MIDDTNAANSGADQPDSSAGVIVCALRSHGNLNLVCIAATVQGSTREIIATGMDAVVDGRV